MNDLPIKFNNYEDCLMGVGQTHDDVIYVYDREKIIEKIMEKLDGSDSKEEELMESLTERTLVIRNGNRTIQRVITDPTLIYEPDFLHFIQVHKSNTFVAKSRIQAILPSISALDSLIQVELREE